MKIHDIPVLLLTGYLGSGKTTLVNKILKNERGIKFAVIVNDIGEVNIDENLIEQGGVVGQKDDSLVALQNGCICCTLKMDLVQQLSEIVAMQKFDYIVIEASGICEPAPIAQTISAYPEMYPEYAKDGSARLDAIVTVVDALRMRDEFENGNDLMAKDLGEDDLASLVIQQVEFCNTSLAGILVSDRILLFHLKTSDRHASAILEDALCCIADAEHSEQPNDSKVEVI